MSHMADSSKTNEGPSLKFHVVVYVVYNKCHIGNDVTELGCKQAAITPLLALATPVVVGRLPT